MTDERPQGRARARTREVLWHSGATSLAAALAVASGLLLDVAIAAGFGAGAGTDAFFVAARLPLGISAIVMVAANQALVPAISTWLATRDEREAWRLTTALLVGAALLTGAVTAIAIAIAAPLVRLTAPGLGDSSVAEAVHLARILFPIVPLVTLAEVFRAVLNARRSFVVPALMHVVLNGVAAAIVLSAPTEGIALVAWAYLAGAVAQLGFLVAAALARGFRFVGGGSLRDPEVVATARLCVRPTVGAGLNPLARIGEQIMISFLPAGSITIMNYGYRLISAIGGSVLFRSVVVVILPRLTHATARGDDLEVRNLTRLGTRIMLAVSVPLTALMAVLAQPAVLAVFRRGSFGADDAELLGVVLAVYAASLVGSALQRALLAPFFARLDTKVPLRNTLYGVLANLALVPVFVAWAGDRPEAVVGVAAAYSIAQYVNVAHAWYRLRRDTGIELRGVGDSAWRLAVAGGAMAATLLGAVGLIGPAAEGSTLVRLARTSVAALLGLAAFAGVAALVGLLDLERGYVTLMRSGPGRGPAPPADPPDPDSRGGGAAAS